ncbi:hypothetical protein NE626_15295, partial [Intestinimonas massiliensis]|uniref:hypothetical protein n=1 Tax=Intestinimonas massiliensis (ex Afouda et al. 2020) TaxID=1673721 RepID=UPI00210C417E
CAMVETAKRHIREGDIFQVVLSNRLEAGFEGSLLDTYRIADTALGGRGTPAASIRSAARL